ncbi:hypothetical protein ACHAQH_006800 [Verticillium albo-atrum]
MISQSLIFGRIDVMELERAVLMSQSRRRKASLIGSGAMFRHHWRRFFASPADLEAWASYTIMQGADQTLSQQLYEPFQK